MTVVCTRLNAWIGLLQTVFPSAYMCICIHCVGVRLGHASVFLPCSVRLRSVLRGCLGWGKTWTEVADVAAAHCNAHNYHMAEGRNEMTLHFVLPLPVPLPSSSYKSDCIKLEKNFYLPAKATIMQHRTQINLAIQKDLDSSDKLH